MGRVSGVDASSTKTFSQFNDMQKHVYNISKLIAKRQEENWRHEF